MSPCVTFFPAPLPPGALPSRLVYLSFLPPHSRHRLLSFHHYTPRPHAGPHAAGPQ
ncbi:unnamed protein product [Gulo gulo]|uniref:Uncharacterized protein n=1 Tax=Gulo gulo TaxID=48420 RepID=A0A9X9LD26_GULGU|nr:unnamed protein product [Gulo gulo]